MTDYTRAQLVEITATKLNVLAPGQSLAAEDSVKINQALDQLFDQLGQDGILSLGDDDTIPASWSPYLAMLAVNLLANDYTTSPFDPAIKAMNEAILRRLVRATETFEPQQAEYF
jgi:hypothetical protein